MKLPSPWDESFGHNLFLYFLVKHVIICSLREIVFQGNLVPSSLGKNCNLAI